MQFDTENEFAKNSHFTISTFFSLWALISCEEIFFIVYTFNANMSFSAYITSFVKSMHIQPFCMNC